MAEAVDKAYQAIRDGIMTGRYAPGSHITAQVLAAASGLSRTPVREAMRRLHSEGLIEIIPNRGAFVASWNEADIEQYFDLVVVLESFAAELAAKRVTEADLVVLRGLADDMNRLVAFDLPPMDEIKDVNDRFHKTIMAICGNSRLENFLSSMIEAELVFSTLRQYDPEELRRAAMQHVELVAALEARDPAWARSVMATHLFSARHAMLRSLHADSTV
jgi:DNA-binding GntR family transcriptional regulator